MDPSRIDLAADRALWFVSDPIVFAAEDLTGATFRMQVRQVPDLGGSPLASIATVTSDLEGVQLTYGGSDTVANHIAAGRLTEDDAAALGYADSATLSLSIIVARISNTTMAAMPAAGVTGQDLALAYDVLVTLPGGHEQKYLFGTFTVRGTVTQ